jgi:Ca2+-binding EF-hand superfamily protein
MSVKIDTPKAKDGMATEDAVERWEEEALAKAHARGQSFRLARHFQWFEPDGNYPGCARPESIGIALDALSVPRPDCDALRRAALRCPGSPPNARDGTPLADCQHLANRILSSDVSNFSRPPGSFEAERSANDPPSAPAPPPSPLPPDQLESSLSRKLKERNCQPRAAFRRLFPSQRLYPSELRSGLRSINIGAHDSDLDALAQRHQFSRKSFEATVLNYDASSPSSAHTTKPGAVDPDMERTMPAPKALSALREKLSALSTIERSAPMLLRDAFTAQDEDLAGSLSQQQLSLVLARFNLRLDDTSFDLLWSRTAGSSNRITIYQLVGAVFPDLSTHDQSADAHGGIASDMSKQWAGMAVDELTEPVKSSVAPEENEHEGGPRRQATGATYRESERATLTPSLSADAAERVLRTKAAEAQESGASAVRSFIKRFDRRTIGSVDLQSFTGALRELNILPNEAVVEDLFLRIGADKLTHLVRTEDLLADLCPKYVAAIEQRKHDYEEQQSLEHSMRSESTSIRIGRQRYSVQRFESVMRNSVEGWSNANKKLRRLFSEHDSDRDGKLKEHELRAALARLHIDPHEDDLHRICSAYAVDGQADGGNNDALVDYRVLTNRVSPDEVPHEWNMENERPGVAWSALQHRMGPEGLQRRLRELVELDTNPRWRLRKLVKRHAFSDPSALSLTASEFASFLMDLNVFPEEDALSRLHSTYKLETQPECVDAHKLIERVLLNM